MWIILTGARCCSVAQSYPTLCGPMDWSISGFPVLQYLPEFAQTHVHWLNDAIQPSHPVSPPSTPALNLSQHPGLFQWVVLPIRWSKDWSFSISPSNECEVKSLNHVRLFATPWTVAYQTPPSMEFSSQEYWVGLPFPSPMNIQGWFPLGWTGLISLLSKGLSRVFSSTTVWKHLILRCSALVPLSHPCMTTGKTIAFTIWNLSAKWCLCFLKKIHRLGLWQFFFKEQVFFFF